MNWQMIPVITKRQNNEVDCGVFICLVMYCELMGYDVNTIRMNDLVSKAQLFVACQILGWQLHVSKKEMPKDATTIDLTTSQNKKLGHATVINCIYDMDEEMTEADPQKQQRR